MKRKKRFLSFLFLLALSFCFSQKLYFKKIELENPAFESKLLLINKELIVHYKESDSLKYFDNYVRFLIVDKKYDEALKIIKQIRNIYKRSYPDYSLIAGIQFEMYASAKKAETKKGDFTTEYTKTFEKKYNELPLISKMFVPDSFKYKEGFNKNEVKRILKESIVEDSISIKDAVLLSRHYNYYKLVEESFPIALPLLKKLENNDFTIADSIVVKTKKGNEISLHYVRSKKNAQPLPSILQFTTYLRKTKYHLNAAKINAERGYNIVIAYSRGIYLSNSQLSPFEFEVEDVNEIIDWIVKQSWSDGKVGMIGGSYDGFSQWAAAKNPHPSLKTIIPSASVGFGIDFPMYNNCFSPYMLRWLAFAQKNTDSEIFNDEKKWFSIYNTYYKSGAAFNKLDSIYGQKNSVFQKWLKHPSFDKYWQSKIPHKRDFSKINIPVLTFTGYYDADQRGALYYYNEHLKHNKKANHYLVIGPYSHSGVVSGVDEEYKGYKIDSVANINIENISYEWFDFILKGKKRPDFLKNKVNYQIMGSNKWKSVESIDKISNDRLKLFLNDSKLQTAKPKKNYIVQKIDFSKREDTLTNFDSEKILDSIIFAGDLKDKLVFESEIFNAPFEINGSFTGALKAAINKKDMDITMTMYEKLANGQYFKLSHEYFARASYAKDNTRRKLLKPDTIEKIPVHNTFFTSRKINKGSKLIVTLGIRKNPDVQINYGTGKDVSEETIKDAKKPLEVKWYNDSYIEIPVFKEK